MHTTFRPFPHQFGVKIFLAAKTACLQTTSQTNLIIFVVIKEGLFFGFKMVLSSIGLTFSYLYLVSLLSYSLLSLHNDGE